MDDWKKDVDSKKSKDKKEVKKPSEVKEWVKSLAEENFHNFTSKNEIMELINIKLNESEIQHGPNVKKGHNNVPEFMSYEAITASGPAVAPTKPSPTTKPGTKPGKPKPQTPYQPGIGPKHKPKALGLNEDDIMELDHEELKNSPRFEEFRKALAKNVNVSVAYVKNDGTVRHMLVKRYLSSYVPSEKERTEKQMAINQTHDVKRVIDLNAYNKSLRETGDKELSAKKAWRTINLDNVLGFMVRGNFIDLRDENEIKDRFGEDVHNSLTKSMVSAMQANQAEVAAEVPEMA
jgi:type IV secretory pathway VirB10-like protein